MIIELKEAAQQALSALDKSQPHPSNPVIGLTNQDFIDHEETIRQLRTAIQQAQQPATGEPVMDVRCEGCGYMTHHREHMGCVRAAKQHTHQAPSVPGDVARDAEFWRYLRHHWSNAQFHFNRDERNTLKSITLTIKTAHWTSGADDIERELSAAMLAAK